MQVMCQAVSKPISFSGYEGNAKSFCCKPVLQAEREKLREMAGLCKNNESSSLTLSMELLDSIKQPPLLGVIEKSAA
jgi:hypothetical protein